MEKEPAWMEKYHMWREQQIASSMSSKRHQPSTEVTVSVEELSSAVGQLSLGQGGVTGCGVGSSGEVAFLAYKKNARALSVRTIGKHVCYTSTTSTVSPKNTYK
jgi:hypothetical protein